MTSNIVIDLVTYIIVHFCIDFTSRLLKQSDYFHIHMDFVILYGSTELKQMKLNEMKLLISTLLHTKIKRVKTD
jgi:hypothetical protein